MLFFATRGVIKSTAREIHGIRPGNVLAMAARWSLELFVHVSVHIMSH
jgi:hypothetical protein